jgi:hypothetical protein
MAATCITQRILKTQAASTRTLSAGNMLYTKGHHNTKTLAANTKQHKQVKSPHLILREHQNTKNKGTPKH